MIFLGESFLDVMTSQFSSTEFAQRSWYDYDLIHLNPLFDIQRKHLGSRADAPITRLEITPQQEAAWQESLSLALRTGLVKSLHAL